MEFNQQRPHEVLGMKWPAEIYRSSKRRMPKKIETYEYPGHYLLRRVSGSGTILISNNQFFVSNTLRGDHCGAEEVDDGIYDLYFRFYQLRRYHLRNNKIRDIVSKVPSTGVKRYPYYLRWGGEPLRSMLPLSGDFWDIPLTNTPNNNSPPCTAYVLSAKTRLISPWNSHQYWNSQQSLP